MHRMQKGETCSTRSLRKIRGAASNAPLTSVSHATRSALCTTNFELLMQKYQLQNHSNAYASGNRFSVEPGPSKCKNHQNSQAPAQIQQNQIP